MFFSSVYALLEPFQGIVRDNRLVPTVVFIARHVFYRLSVARKMEIDDIAFLSLLHKRGKRFADIGGSCFLIDECGHGKSLFLQNGFDDCHIICSVNYWP